ncbi:MAG: DMT family transporter [Lachnospiraceae bacterium]|nr:DMT family transporter [Lachnospiraceae bacterium]
MKGIVYALLAAFCNSCIGIFSSILMEQGLSSTEIAFMRCFVALLFTFALCMLNVSIRKKLKLGKLEVLKYAILAFFGINIMYIFETTAIQYIPVSLVSFLLYASGILTIILSCIFLKEHMSIAKIIAIIVVFIGIGIMFISNLNMSGSLVGIVYAIIAGAGYSLYIFGVSLKMGW